MEQSSNALIQQERLPASKPAACIGVAGRCMAGQMRFNPRDVVNDSQCGFTSERFYSAVLDTPTGIRMVEEVIPSRETIRQS
jgi:hypothetical protein